MATDYRPQGFGRSREHPASGAAVSSSSGGMSAVERQARRALDGSLDAESLATGLGWFSLILGIAELASPGTVGNLAGVGKRNVMLRGAGVRDLAAGVGILTQRNRAPWLWARVGGDVMDLALLATGLRSTNTRRGRAAASLAAVAGITALDFLAAVQLTRGAGRAAFRRAGRELLTGATGQADFYLEKSVVINKPPEECYRFWRNLENLPRFLKRVESVRPIDERRSHWVAKGPAATKVEWESEITEDRPNEKLTWRTLDGTDVTHAGSVIFERAPGGRGTVVRVSMHYSPAGGRFTARLSTVLGDDPHMTVKEDLRRFKQVLEAGEIPTTRGQPTGRRSLFARASRQWGQS